MLAEIKSDPLNRRFKVPVSKAVSVGDQSRLVRKIYGCPIDNSGKIQFASSLGFLNCRNPISYEAIFYRDPQITQVK
jgi:hypothetical protein